MIDNSQPVDLVQILFTITWLIAIILVAAILYLLIFINQKDTGNHEDLTKQKKQEYENRENRLL